MKITFNNAALSITIEDESDSESVVEILDALKAFRVTAITHNPVAATTVEVAPAAEAAPEPPAVEAAPEPPAAEEMVEVAPVPTVDSVYGEGYLWPYGETNPLKGFRQPVVGDIFLDPDVMAPRRKITAAEYGPRLILTYR